jgi:cation:H+ antiporter
LSVLVVVALVGGFALLAVAPDRFVAGSAGLADRWGVSRVVIGAVVVGFGTSTPEMLVSGVAAHGGEPEVGVGNVIGSNMANLGLIIGVAALVGRIAVPSGLLRRELPLMVAATVVFAVAVRGGLSRPEGLMLFAVLAAALVLLLRQARAQDPDPAEVELAEEVQEFFAEEAAQPRGRMVADTVAGLAGTLVGAQLLVWGAVDVAERLDLSGGFIGLTIVALGTSLPELVTAVAAARAGEDQLILGNVLGSNLFNCLAVGGVVGVVGPAALDDTALTVTAVGLMLVITGLATAVLMRHQQVTRHEAVGLLVIYLACLPLLAG